MNEQAHEYILRTLSGEEYPLRPSAQSQEAPHRIVFEMTFSEWNEVCTRVVAYNVLV